jgi:hypothetical protein
VNTEKKYNWQTLNNEFRFSSALTLSRMEALERFQTLNDRNEWLHSNERPLIILFVSHRWESSEHPDPSGLQIKALQYFISQISVVIRAFFCDRDERLSLVPDLAKEGILQAEELARRIIGYGPFADGHLISEGKSIRQEIAEKIKTLDPESFDLWLLSRIGLWVDYCCIPQAPRSAVEQTKFDSTLAQLDYLLEFATVISLRREGDDYSERAWCVSEVLLGAKRSFARSLFIDIERINSHLSVQIPSSPADTAVANAIIQDGYDNDYKAFRDALFRWENEPNPLKDTPPDPWSAYRSLQGSALLHLQVDPNPGRRGVEFVRNLSVELISRWWMPETKMAIDLEDFFNSEFAQVGLLTTEPSDRIYLGLILMKNGWVEELQPFFDECLSRLLTYRNSLKIEMQPTTQTFRNLLKSIYPNSPDIWFSRLSQKGGHSPEEKTAIEALRKEMIENPLAWNFV